ncbi:anthranilate synthase component I family protein [Thermovibrio ammonificans]|uniref:Anthranilate synthase n=1 Tax=Thermovibrio ammonificans (strain DSM 15698 / JCM 12110 / HB-1) TaxID=648996 RepID=E8T596_THEA1|nr:anthranilate synthase component I family protein [Thermovibrio ammonificans]ADU96434.1 Anthranilate synthase [Thermovibrio ammonificans HB-1]
MRVFDLPFADPFKVFLWLKERGYPVRLFLDSAQVNPKTGRYSFICLECEEELRLAGDPAAFEKLNRLFFALKERYSAGDLPFGLFGYVTYDANRFIEELPTPFVNDIGMPELHFILPKQLLIFDNVKRKLYGVSLEGPLPELKELPDYCGSYSSRLLGFNMDREYFYWAVNRIKEFIAAGDTFQVNFSQRIDLLFEGDPVALYSRLRSINPSPFAFYFELGGFTAVSCSPERLLKLEGRLAQTRPIAGTRRRGRTEEEDRALERELFLSEKERAEHVMLVDLERNDLGRVCRYGTVEVDELMVPERYSHVTHIVSNVRGILREDVSPIEALVALFPGGTITGAPKIRTMEIIAQLEPTWRNLYTGSVGYLGFNGEADFNIVIRTLILKGNRAYLQVGAGIVADSRPEREYRETLHKGRALLESLGVEL